MKHKPCGLLGNLQIAVDFVGRDAILAIGHKPDRGEPFVKTERGILKDSSGLNGELPLRMASTTLPPPLVLKKANR